MSRKTFLLSLFTCTENSSRSPSLNCSMSHRMTLLHPSSTLSLLSRAALSDRPSSDLFECHIISIRDSISATAQEDAGDISAAIIRYFLRPHYPPCPLPPRQLSRCQESAKQQRKPATVAGSAADYRQPYFWKVAGSATILGSRCRALR